MGEGRNSNYIFAHTATGFVVPGWPDCPRRAPSWCPKLPARRLECQVHHVETVVERSEEPALFDQRKKGCRHDGHDVRRMPEGQPVVESLLISQVQLMRVAKEQRAAGFGWLRVAVWWPRRDRRFECREQRLDEFRRKGFRADDERVGVHDGDDVPVLARDVEGRTTKAGRDQRQDNPTIGRRRIAWKAFTFNLPTLEV